VSREAHTRLWDKPNMRLRYQVLDPVHVELMYTSEEYPTARLLARAYMSDRHHLDHMTIYDKKTDVNWTIRRTTVRNANVAGRDPK